MTTPLLQCPSCSAEISVASRFCSFCGHELEPLSQMPTAAPRGLPATARHISSDSVPAGGFTPGVILGGRYRIIGMLGRGGMGEVYRADDLKLGQAVALKFLPKALAADPIRRERFFAEVRITRQLAHPNICRVYDIDEFDGQHFLSMEYIDGEDLASLIKRIGFLTNEKALEIARQLAAGLAAAHEKGVLHRDLKPANIMIDGHGRVRITDFGLAIATADEEKESAVVLGTPAYMAPEQFTGKGATTRSDIYALGLVFFEIYTGKRAFTGETMADLRHQKEGQNPSAPSELRQGIDPVVDRLIVRCLEREPRARPTSVAQLAFALPGGDPLAAALAAGETPSPGMVAAAGVREGFRPLIALAILVWVILGSAIAATLGNPAGDTTNREKSPAILAERAREFLNRAGYTDPFANSASGFFSDLDYANFLGQTALSASDRRLHSPIPGFWYRVSPRPLQPPQAVLSGVSANDPPLQFPGEALVTLDEQGQLKSMRVIAPREKSSSPESPSSDWSVLFSEAGLDPSGWASIDPQRNPSVFADTQAAWKGSLPELPGVEVRIEAAMYHGKPVSFEVIGPWTGTLYASQQSTFSLRVLFALVLVILITLLGGVVFFVRRNLRLGRGDRKGAARLAIAGLCLITAFWVLRVSHQSALQEFPLVVGFLSQALSLTALFWAVYIALEPIVRRRWATVLVSWVRLLSGEWNDPLLGRDVLIGCGIGVFAACLIQAFGYGVWALPTEQVASVISAAPRLAADQLGNAMGAGWFASRLSAIVAESTLVALAFLFQLALTRMILRSDRLALFGMALHPVLIFLPGLVYGFAPGSPGGLPPALLYALFYQILWLFVLRRFGLVTLAVAWLISGMFRSYPMTLSSSPWYSPASYAALGIILLIAIYGFRISIAGQPILDLRDSEA